MDDFQQVLTGNICLSGGAKGADAQWGMNAGRNGFNVIHWSFAGHHHSVAESEIVLLTDEQLTSVDATLKTAAKNKGSSYPGKRSEFVKNLLRRNFYQVAYSDSLYAVSTIRKGKVQGGTGWAVQMFLDRFKNEAQFEALPLFVYEQDEEQWYQYIGSWKAIDAPPVPTGIWAGIGTRELNDAGKWAIRSLFGWNKPLE